MKRVSPTRELIRFLVIVNGSLEETKYLILLAHDLKYISSLEFNKLEESMNLIGRMLFKLRQSLGKKIY